MWWMRLQELRHRMNERLTIDKSSLAKPEEQAPYRAHELTSEDG